MRNAVSSFSLAEIPYNKSPLYFSYLHLVQKVSSACIDHLAIERGFKVFLHPPILYADTEDVNLIYMFSRPLRERRMMLCLCIMCVRA